MMSAAIGVSAVLVAGCEGEPTATPAVAASPEPTPPPRGQVPGEPFPAAECCTGIELAPGRYLTPEFIPLAMSVEVGAGWKGYQNETDGVFVFVKGANAVLHGTQWLLLTAVSPNTAQAFLDAFRGTPKLTIGPSTPVTVAGLMGQALEATAQPNPGEPGGPSRVPGVVEIRAMGRITRIPHGWTTETQEARLRIIVLEAIPSLDVVAYVEAPQALFDQVSNEANDILSTLMFATG